MFWYFSVAEGNVFYFSKLFLDLILHELKEKIKSIEIQIKMK